VNSQVMRLLRRAARRRRLALAMFVLAVAIQFWAMHVPIAGVLPHAVVASAGDRLVFVDLVGEPAILHHQGSASIDVRFDRARFAPPTARLLALLGIALPADDAPLSWVTTEGADGVSVLGVERADPTGVVGTLKMSAAPVPGAGRVAQLELEADAMLRVTMGTSLVPGTPGTRKLLRFGDQEIELDGELPLQVLTSTAPMRAVLPLAEPGEPLRISLGAARERIEDGVGLAIRGLGVGAGDDGLRWFACAAPAGQARLFGTRGLAEGRCDATETINIHELQIRAGVLEAYARGTAWLWDENGIVGTTLFARWTDNPAIATLVLLVDGLLSGWLVLAALSLRRRARYRVFLSYRRGDSAGHAGRLYARLVESMGDGAVFIDVDKIPPGTYFEQVIARRIHDAESVIVVIGPDWLDARDAAGQRRLDLPEDFVRREIEMAFMQHKRVIPVLVGGAVMPEAQDLPSGIARLSQLNAFIITHASFDRDADALADILLAREASGSTNDAAFGVSMPSSVTKVDPQMHVGDGRPVMSGRDRDDG